MTKLECHVNSCANNTANFCCRPNIQVSGAMAFDSEQTCCSSYLSLQQGAFSNSTGYDSPNEQMPVGCEAQNCSYNAGGSCVAGQITISGSGASQKGETSCQTFRTQS